MLTELGHWIEVRDGDPRVLGLFRCHYTARRNKAYSGGARRRADRRTR